MKQLHTASVTAAMVAKARSLGLVEIADGIESCGHTAFGVAARARVGHLTMAQAGSILAAGREADGKHVLEPWKTLMTLMLALDAGQQA